MHALGDNEAEVVGETVRKPLAPVRGRIGMPERGLHPDLTIAQFDRADRDVVGPQVKSAAAFEIKAGVVPMTGQNAVLDAAALEREARPIIVLSSRAICPSRWYRYLIVTTSQKRRAFCAARPGAAFNPILDRAGTRPDLEPGPPFALAAGIPMLR